MPADVKENNNRIGGTGADKVHIALMAILCVFFFGIVVLFGSPTYNDSDQYIQMHVHREPLYPLFLWVLRKLTPAHYLTLASVLQSALCVFASYSFITYLEKAFTLKTIPVLLLCGIVTAPYILTPISSKMHVQLSAGIISESVAIPVFLLFIIWIHKALVSPDFSYPKLIRSFIISLILTLIRSQMIFTFVLWLIVALIMCIRHMDKPKTAALRAALCVLIFIAGMICRDTATRTYNYIFNGRYVDSVYSHINLLANMLYVTDRDMGEQIEDPNLRDIFYELYDRADENAALYIYAGSPKAGAGEPEESGALNEPGSSYGTGPDVVSRVIYLEEVHDLIKYDCIEYGLRDIVEESTGIHDYIEYNRIADGYAGDLIGELLPLVSGRWLADVIILGSRGLIRNIAVVHPLMIVYAGLMLIIAFFITVNLFKRDIGDPAAMFMLTALLSVFGNSYSTAMVIMCLSRYMIYGFPVFYSGLMIAFISYKKRLGVTEQRHSGGDMA